MELSEDEGEFLLEIARSAIEKFTRGEKIEPPRSDEIEKRFQGVCPKCFNEKRGVFCTIHKITSSGGASNKQKKELRGCIGMPYPTMRLMDALLHSAESACQDPRFSKLCEDELGKIKIELSILTEPEPIEAKNPDELLRKIVPHKDGLIIKYGYSSGLFLPQVWEQLPEREEFLRNLCLKAGLYPDTWKDQKAKFFRFHVQVFDEE